MGAAAPLIAVQAGVGLYGSYAQSKAIKEQGRAEEQMAESNARLAELNAEDAILHGRTEAGQVKRRGRFIKGSQRSGFAGQGVDVNTGSAAAIQEETGTMSELDALTVQNNAWREAWGYKTEAINLRAEGRMKRLASKSEARNTLLTGGLNAATDITRGAYMANQFKDSGPKRNPGSGSSVPRYLQNRSTSANKLRLY